MADKQSGADFLQSRGTEEIREVQEVRRAQEVQDDQAVQGVQEARENPTRDHPEQYPTEQPSLFDRFESELNVDPIPVEDLNLEVREEKDKEATKHASSSERKYHTGFGD